MSPKPSFNRLIDCPSLLQFGPHVPMRMVWYSQVLTAVPATVSGISISMSSWCTPSEDIGALRPTVLAVGLFV